MCIRSSIRSCVTDDVLLLQLSHLLYTPEKHTTIQYSLHTAHQRVSAGKYAVLVNTLPQPLVVLWLLLGLLAVPEYLLEEEVWNRLASHALLEKLAHRGGLQEVVRLTR